MLNSSRPAIRVLHITDSLGSGGKERQLIELLRGFSKIDGFVNELVVLSDTIHYDEVGSLGIKISSEEAENGIFVFSPSRSW